MGEWPEAERLRQALQEVTYSPGSPDEQWRAIEDKIALGAANSHPIEHKTPTDRVPYHRARRWRSVRLLPAAAAAAALFVLAFQLLPLDDPISTITTTEIATPAATAAPNPPVPPATATTPPTSELPSLALNKHDCQALPLGPYRVQDQAKDSTIWAGGPVDGPAARAGVYVISEQSQAWIERTGLSVDTKQPELVLVMDPTVNALSAFKAASTRFCTLMLPTLILTDQSSSQVEHFCRQPVRSDGWRYLVLVDTDVAPPDCAGTKPTYLIDSRPAQDPGVQAWSEAHQCQSPETTADADANLITEWADCAATLIHVQVATDDAWLATIDGEPTIEFWKRLYDTPR